MKPPPAARLPDLTLPGAGGGPPIPLRSPGRQGTVLLLLHSLACHECRGYVDSLARTRAQLEDWDGRVVVVAPQSDASHIQRELPFATAIDEGGECARRCDAGGGSMLIADQWGEIFFVHRGEPGSHAFPAPDEVVEWLRFVAIQCPECQGEAW
jgi:RNA polymerase subunit RPABC4/transcription elongation factor Spt4